MTEAKPAKTQAGAPRKSKLAAAVEGALKPASDYGECNVATNTLFTHDNLEVMRGINSECVDLIYLDPPFNTGRHFSSPLSDSPENKQLEYTDVFRSSDLKDDWVLSIQESHPRLHHYLESIKAVADGRRQDNYTYCYLAFMAVRLLEMRRVLKPTGEESAIIILDFLRPLG